MLLPKLVQQLIWSYFALVGLLWASMWALNMEVFWPGTLFIIFTGIAQAGLSETLSQSKPERLGTVFMVAGVVRMLLAAGALLLPMVMSQGVDAKPALLQFVVVYVVALSVETTLVAIRLRKV